MPWVACSDPDMPRYCTPANVSDDLTAMGLVLTARGQREGWRTVWAGQDAVKVYNPGASRAAHVVVAEQLAGLGWAVEVNTDWVRVSGMRAARRAGAGEPDAAAEVFWHDRHDRDHPRPQPDDDEPGGGA